MKKFLSLVLALVMTMSLVTVSAGAKDFSDDDSITYQEAVDVISEIGVVDGYTGGDFKPTDVLTRGAAAKIICNLILGPTTASALSASSAPFKDVPVSNTFAGYITYCAQEKIINGYPDGSFRPEEALSFQHALLLLYRAAGSPEVAADQTFTDVPANAYYAAAVRWAAANKITTGTGNNCFSPAAPCIRAQIVTLLYNQLHA